MLRGRLALVTVYLCLVCLLGLMPQPAARSCTIDIIEKVDFLIGKAPGLKWLDCRLYTPTIQDYQQNCPSSTLKCFADEMKVLIEEWETVSVRGIRGIRQFKLNLKLGKLATKLNQTKPDCLQCELLKEEEAEKFLRDLQSTLEMMNTQQRC